MVAAATDNVSMELLDRLEDFFCGPEFTTSLGEFFSQVVEKLDFVPLDQEQPLMNHAAFKQYTNMVDQQLSRFLTEEGISQQAIFAAAQRAQEDAAGSSALACLDYIVACTEYEAFMELAYDHKCVQDAEHNGGDWLPIGESLGELEAF